jgi:hypothetical protein
MEYSLLQVIAGKTGLQAGELARERIRSLFLTSGAENLACSSQALDESSRREMEALTGYDLSAARINNTFLAGSLARSINAEAFTLGKHIFAPAEKINTSFSGGRGLLAHELTHVIQQTSPARALPPTPGDEAATDAPVLPQQTSGEDRTPLPLIQASRVSPAREAAQQPGLEAEAERQETAAREGEREQSQGAEIDTNMLAEMVYRLMQNDLLVHLDRRR